jgi:hypothetical protein
MFAIISESHDEKNTLFKSALKNLSHIKYYYLEALYFYCKFLKDSENDAYHKYLNQGLELSKKYYYQYIQHLFDNLQNSSCKEYLFSYALYPVNNLEDYVNKHNAEWEKVFNERQSDY